MVEDSYRDMKAGPSCGSMAVSSDPEELKKRILSQNTEILTAVQAIAKAVESLPADPRAPGTSPKALLVGGFVRDTAFGLKPKDADVQVYGLAPADLELLLEHLFPDQIKKVGKSYEILKVRIDEGHDIDVSIARKGSSVEQEGFYAGDPTVTPEEAAAQRDFSMNNLAADPCTGEVFDFCDGLNDLRAGHLKVTNREVFRSRGIHVFRAAQFAARLRLKPDAEAFSIMSEMVREGITDNLHPARLTEEFNKMLVKGCQPSRGLELLRRLGVISSYFPELDKLIQEKPVEKDKKSYWVKTLMIVDRSAKILFQREEEQDPRESFTAMLAALCSQLVQVKEGRPPDFSLARSFLDRFFMSPAAKAAVISTILNYSKIDEFYCQFEKEKETQKQQGSPTVRRAGIRMPLRAPQADSGQAKTGAAKRILNAIYPANYSSAVCLSEAIYSINEPSGVHKAGSFFAQAVKSAGLDKQRKRSLLQKEEIIQTLNLERGMHIGYIIGEIEKLRYDLVTRENALSYLKDNVSRLMTEAKEKGVEAEEADG